MFWIRDFIIIFLTLISLLFFVKNTWYTSISDGKTFIISNIVKKKNDFNSYTAVVITNLNFLFIFSYLLAIIYLLELFYVQTFIHMYIYIELITFLSCILLLKKSINYNGTHNKASIKGYSWFRLATVIKYFFLSAFASNFFLLGLFFIYYLLGSLELNQVLAFVIMQYSVHNEIFLLGMLYILLALFFKIGVVPLHTWIIDLYEICSYALLIFFSIISKIVYSWLIILIIYCLVYPIFFFLQTFLVLFGILSIIIGSFGAVLEFKIKRVLAYSTIINFGFFLIGLAGGTIITLSLTLIQLYFYCFTSVVILYYLNSYNLVIPLYYMSDFGNIKCDLFFLILWFVNSGFPPFYGFLTKAFLMSHLWSNFIISLKVFIILGIFLTLFSMFFYVRWIKVILFETNSIKKDVSFMINKYIIFCCIIFFSLFNLFYDLIVFYFTLLLMKGLFSFLLNCFLF